MSGLTDLHTHILPGIDDGAADTTVSAALLQAEQAQGVDTIVLTPHFRANHRSMESFLSRRAAAYERLLPVVPEGMELLLGAEVAYTTALSKLDLRKLCLGETNYLLLELPMDHRPYGLDEMFYTLEEQGCWPLLAHVERFPYLEQEPTMLWELVERGAAGQMNAETLLGEKKTQKYARKLIDWGLVQVLSSDCHNPEKRPPQLQEGLQRLEDWYGADLAARFVQNGALVAAGRELPFAETVEPKKTLFGWR